MTPLEASITSFTPDHGWTAHFTGLKETWTEPVIGWAVVVTYTDDGSYEQGIRAVVLTEGRYAVTIVDYIEERDPGLAVRLKRTS